MSIAAFPVLARILTERKLLNPHLGTVSIDVAAVDDVAEWCILTFAVWLVRSNEAASIWLVLGGVAAYVLVMLIVVWRFLWRLEAL